MKTTEPKPLWEKREGVSVYQTVRNGNTSGSEVSD